MASRLDHRHEHVELEVALGGGEADGGVVAHDLHATMVTASHWVGFTLPGMMELPGSFSGMLISPMPQRGPLA
jgi:ABC-type iron transport system FetAB permease component